MTVSESQIDAAVAEESKKSAMEKAAEAG